MRFRFKVLATGLLVMAFAAAPLLAQSKTTGAIRGIVTDETGARIPGVLVEIQSPDMIGGRRAMTTDGTGSYRFPELPPGHYALTFTLDGYQTLRREEIGITASKTFDLDAQLTPHKGEETIVVTGKTPLVDTASSGTTTSFDDEYLQNLPTSRFQPDTLNLAPGIENSAAYGGGGSSANAYQIDGVDVSDPEGGTPWSFLNYNIIKEVQLIGLGAPAEYGGFTGVLFNSVTKSGSNKFEGLAEAYLYPKNWVQRNTVDNDIEPTSIDQSYDVNVNIGGPFIKDKLWYFVSAQYLRDDTSTGGPIRTEKDPRLFARLDWQINSNNTLTFWGEWDRYDITGRGGDAITPIEATVTEDAPEWVWNFTWRSVLTPKVSLNVAYTGYTGYYYLDPASGYNKPGAFDFNTGTFVDNSTYYYLADRYRHILNASISQYSDTFLTGKHDFKYGVELERSRTRSRGGIPGDAYYYTNYPYSPSYNVDYAYLGYYTYDQRGINSRVSAFVQDSWQVNNRLTINPGVRLDMNRGSVPGHGNIFRTNPVAPRLGFTFDLTGRKKTLLKAHYGRYYEALFSNFYQFLGPEASSDQFFLRLNRTAPGFSFDPRNFDPNNLSPGVTIVSSQPEQRYALDREIKHPYVDQYLLAVEHDFGNDLAVKAELVYRRNKDFIESVFDPADFEEVTALGPDGKPVKLFNQTNLDELLTITNPNGLKREYAGLLLTATKRLSNRWQMLVSYARSHATGNIDNVDFSFADEQGSNYGPSPFLNTPNSLINSQGTLTNDFKNEITAQGQYIIPGIEATVSLDYRYVSGQTYAKVGRVATYLLDPMDPNSEVPFNQGRVRYFTEARGDRRLDAQNLLNFRIEKYFPLEGGGRLGIYADAFNVFNTGEDLEVQTRAGSGFGDTLTYSAPLTYRMGVRYNW